MFFLKLNLLYTTNLIYITNNTYNTKNSKNAFQSVLRALKNVVFFLVSCKKSQNVNTLQLLTWNKFKVLK